MKRFLLLLAASALLLLAARGHGSPVPPVDPFVVGPLSSQTFQAEFMAGKRASAIALGDKSTYIGLYVFDTYGNCVAWDDEGAPDAHYACAVEWFAPEKAVYTIEVRNNSTLRSKCKVIVR
jgi:hypothetical protein